MINNNIIKYHMESNNQLNANDAAEKSDEKSTSKINLKILIPIIIGAIVVIVVVIVFCVVLIGKDDDSSSSEENYDYSDNLSWEQAYEIAKNKLKNWSNDEKYLLFYSTENILGKCEGSIDGNLKRNFPGICLQDGPAGVRFSKKTTSWQASINTASTFDRDLIYKVDYAQGKEFKDKGINIMLSPCINMLRNPTGGRYLKHMEKIHF